MKINFENKNLRIVLMAILLVVSCFMTYYFHGVLGLGTIFSHFFYIPIIFASIWWKKMGILVATFLAAVLLFSHNIFREIVLTNNDYIRAVSFIAIAFVAAWLGEQIEKGKVRIDHLNTVLCAIRNVNQLITKEKDRDKLIKSVCKNLVETRGYHNSWIVLLDKSGEFVSSAEAGLGKDFEPKLKQLKRNDLNECGRSALKQFDVVVIKDPSSACGDCPLAKSCAARGVAMAVQLKYGEKVYGLLYASMDRNFLYVEELSLFKEVASDIAFALYNIEMEKRRKKAEEQIRASLKEKEVLLQEVHHRVKNNMQIISSLFNLQSGHIKDKQAFEIFKSSQNRVRSMALIHERLYQSKDFTKVDFAEYAQNLTGHLFSSHGISPGAVKLNLNIKDVFLDLNTAIPCGLIINELVSNSLKHAFPEEKNGEIKISMHPLNKEEIEVIVSDNGVGLPKEVDFRNTESLGLHLVNLLAEDQLHGDIKLDRAKGTSFHIIFRTKR